MSPRMIWRPVESGRSARMIGQASSSNGVASAKPGGAVSRMTVVGASEASQSAGSAAANAVGAQGKAQSPAPGHHLPLRGGASPRAHDVSIVGSIAGIAPQKLLCKSRPVEKASIAIACLFAGHARSPEGRSAGCPLMFLRAIPTTREADPHLWGYPPAHREPADRSGRQSRSRRAGRFQTRSYSPSSPEKSCAKMGATKLGSSSLTER